MTSCNFLLDLIVTQFESPLVKAEDYKNLKIEVTFNDQVIPITSSRINVSEFKSGSSKEFKVDPDRLRHTLEECGMPIVVKYAGKLLGTAQVIFPQNVISQIAEGMPDLLHVETCRIAFQGETVGCLELFCRLLLKCEETPKMLSPNECLLSMDKSISPDDILFIMSECQRTCNLDDDGYEPMKLGNIRQSSTDHIAEKHKEIFKHDPLGDSVCNQIKDMGAEYDRVVETIRLAMGQVRPPCRTAGLLRAPCGEPCTSAQPKMAANRLEQPDPSQGIAGRPTCKDRLQPKRFCPVCLHSMTYLPAFANCPKCGIKPMPYPLKQRCPAGEEASLQMLPNPFPLATFCNNPPLDPGPKPPKHIYKCRCRCKYNKPCAYCRVRQANPDLKLPVIHELSDPDEDFQEDLCQTKKSEEEFRPFLSRVFSELRVLYNIDTAEPKKKMPYVPRKKKQGTTRPAIKSPRISKPVVPVAQKPKKPVARKRNTSPTHKLCAQRPKAISRKHGWDWCNTKEARAHGWRPGSVLKPIKRVMNYFLKTAPKTDPCSQAGRVDLPPPMLNITKKNGDIFITLKSVDTNNMRMKPIVFKVVKSDLAVALSEIKRNLKAQGFPKCVCHSSVMMCSCRDIYEKKELERELEEECASRGMENCVDHLVLTDTSESDLEFNFDMGSAGVSHYSIPPKPHAANNSTQTLPKGTVTVEPRYPIPTNPYWRHYDCATGDSYGPTAFGDVGENVFEDGVFRYRGGGPHGPHSRARATAGRHAPSDYPGGKSFPAQPKRPAKSAPATVRMPRRYYKALEEAKAAKAAAEEDKVKKKPTDMMAYMMKMGTIPKPWNPNDKA